MATGGWIRPLRRLAIMLRDADEDGWPRCVYCRAPFSTHVLTIDHVRPTRPDERTPLRWGGTARDRASNRASNLVTSCLQCNQIKARDDVSTLAIRAQLPVDAVRRRVHLVRRRRLTRATARARALLAAPPPWLRWMLAAHATVGDRQAVWGRPAEVLAVPLAEIVCPWCPQERSGPGSGGPDGGGPCPGCLDGYLTGAGADQLPEVNLKWRLPGASEDKGDDNDEWRDADAVGGW